MEKTVVELFAGVGGFRIGLTNANPDWKFVMANQWEPGKKVQHAFDCYSKRFNKYSELEGKDSITEVQLNTDISTVEANEIPSHSLLVGGFPCQDYSVARTGATGLEGKKGVLWWEIYRIAKEKKPSFLLLENVDRLLKSPSKQRGRDFGVMLYSLYQLGYTVEWRIINAAEYGFAQRRRRVFIFAFKNDTNYSKTSNLTEEKDNLKDWLHTRGFFQNEFPIQHDYESKHKPVYDKTFLNKEIKDVADISDTFALSFRNSGVMHNGVIYTEETLPDYTGHQVTLGEILETGRVDERYFLTPQQIEKFNYLKGPKRIERTSKEGFSYIFSEGGMTFPDDLSLPGRTMLTSEASVNRSTHVVSDKVTGKLRFLTPVEAERLNGFPDNWTDSGMPEKFRYFTMGNALVVSLIEKMGKTLDIIFQTE